MQFAQPAALGDCRATYDPLLELSLALNRKPILLLDADGPEAAAASGSFAFSLTTTTTTTYTTGTTTSDFSTWGSSWGSGGGTSDYC